MWNYLKPLRRKIGVVMLLLACVFAVGWVRSRIIADILEYPSGTAFLVFGSQSGRIDIQRAKTFFPADSSSKADLEVLSALHQIALELGDTVSIRDGSRELFMENGVVEVHPGESAGQRLVEVKVPLENGYSTHEATIPVTNRSSLQRDAINFPKDIQRFKAIRPLSHWRLFGLEFVSRRFTFTFSDLSRGGTRITHIEFWVVPYWLIVVPLTLLSTWLLLSKPRVAKTTPVIEPEP